ncbi:MAG: hypothetical protein WDO19_26735 [Bacteroidota bacterium]
MVYSSGNDSGYHVGFRSLFDHKKEIAFQYFPRNDSLLKPVNDHEDLQQLIRFSGQFYTVEKWNDTLVFNDLRFGPGYWMAGIAEQVCIPLLSSASEG